MSENIVVMIMVGIVIPGISLGIVCVAIFLKDEVQKWRRDAFDKKVIFIGVTQIATDLVPLMLKLVRKYGAELRMRTFGVDGAYFASLTAWLWNFAIKHALKRDVQVDYVLRKMNPKAEKSLSKLAKSSKGDALRVYVVQDSLLDDEVQAHLDEMRTRHATLFTGPDNARAMWLEGKHKEGGTYAYNVRYVSPRAMVGEWEEEYFRQRDMLAAVVKASERYVPGGA